MSTTSVTTTTTKNDVPRKETSVVTPIFVAAVVFPITMILCMGNMIFRIFTVDDGSVFTDGYNIISPARWLAATIAPILFVTWGLKRNSLDTSGALLGLVVGFILTLSSYCFLGCLAMFFLTSSKATKFRSHLKRRIEQDFREGGQRNWLQVLCNGAMATELALLYMVDSGCGERPIDFLRDYRASWLGIGVLGAIACSNGDTWASEFGSVIGSSDPFLITSGKKVPRGTNGGVSPAGLLFSFLGGVAVGAAYYVAVLHSTDTVHLQSSPSQWPLTLVGGVGGLVGSIIDSILGATLQFSGMNLETGSVVPSSGPKVKHVSGISLLDNHSVNLLSSIATALILPRFAILVWP